MAPIKHFRQLIHCKMHIMTDHLALILNLAIFCRFGERHLGAIQLIFGYLTLKENSIIPETFKLRINFHLH